MSLAAQEPAFMRSVREQARKLASLRLHPTPTRVNLKPAEVKRPAPIPAVPPRRAGAPALPGSTRTFSTTSPTSKALAHVVSAGDEQAHRPPPTASRFSPEGATAARAHEPRSAGAQAVLQGRRKGRTLKSLSLDNKVRLSLAPPPLPSART